MPPSHRHIILASGSPRRLALLRAHGIEPEVIVPALDEEALASSWPEGLTPQELAERLALCKARAAYEQLLASPPLPKGRSCALILAADTVVYKEGVGVLGKPACREEAVAMLQALQNSSHTVVSGVALIEVACGKTTSFTEESTVHFGRYSLVNIEDYLVREPPYDKAGSYAIQGSWAKHVTRLEGDLENVIGLPFYRIESLLRGGTSSMSST